MRNRWWLLLLAVGLIAGLAACSSNKDAAPPASQPTATEADSTTTSPAESPEPAVPPTEPTEVPVAAVDAPPDAAASAEDVVPAPESAFSRAQLALEQLESYRYTTSFLFVGEEEGEPESGSIELTGIVAGPDLKHLTWRTLEEDESFEVIQIGEEAWILDDGAWEKVPVLVAEAMSQAALVYAPSVTWSGLFGELEPDSTYVGKDTVNGIPADHYTATYRQWGNYWQGDLIDAVGDVWIAEAGYPVKYHFSATGVDEDGDRGTVTWTMDLSDVNEPILLEPPL